MTTVKHFKLKRKDDLAQSKCGEASPSTFFSGKRKHKNTAALLEQTLWVGHNSRRQSEASTFSPANIDVKSWVLISIAVSVSIMRPLFFELIERAIQLLLGCQRDAESFLSAEHSVVGEIEDDLAQAYATLGMACVFIFCCGEQVCLVGLVMTPASSGWLSLSLSIEAALPSI